MIIQSAKYTGTGQVEVKINGNAMIVPVALENRHRVALIKWQDAGGVINAFTPPPFAPSDVRDEADKRMISLLGARDATHKAIIISNGEREAIRLLRIGEANWTSEQASRSAILLQVDLAIEAIRSSSNILEALHPVPVDYTDDKHWP